MYMQARSLIPSLSIGTFGRAESHHDSRLTRVSITSVTRRVKVCQTRIQMGFVIIQ